MQGLFDAPGWNLGAIAKEAPTKLSKSQEKKAFKRKKLVEVALGQAAPRKPKVRAEEAEQVSTPMTNKNGQQDLGKRKIETNQQNAASRDSSKKQKFDNKRNEHNEARATNDKSFSKSARESVHQNDTKPSTKDHMEVDSKLAMGQGTNRSNYVSVLSADPQDAYVPQSAMDFEQPKPAVKQTAKKVNKKEKNGSEPIAQKSTEVEASSTIANAATEEHSGPTLSKAQRKRLARQQRQQAKDEGKDEGKNEVKDEGKDGAKADDLVSDATTEVNGQTKPKPAVPTKKVDDKQKKKLQAALAKSSSSKTESSQASKVEPKKEHVKPAATKAVTKADATNKAAAAPKLTALQQKMKDKLSGSRFRWLNEQLYTTPGDESFTLFQEKPELFEHYHAGFRHQVESWPTNPVDVMIDYLQSLPTSTVIADMGCGDAKIAHTLTKHKVLSFDLVAKNDKVVACDIAKLPLPKDFVDVVVFCLSLMGTNYVDFIREAHRVLKEGSELKIAEVISRFSDVDAFIELMDELGFEFMDKDDSNKMFILLDFVKKPTYAGGVDAEDSEMLKGLNMKQKKALKKGLSGGQSANANNIARKAKDLLKPCLYKKR